MSIVLVDFTEFQQSHERFTLECRAHGHLLQIDYPGNGLSMYVVADHAGANEVLRNEHGSFVHFADYFASLQAGSETDRKIGEIFAKNLGNDNELHRELRKDIRKQFNGSGVDQHNPFIQATVRELALRLPVLAAANNGIVDLTKDFSMPMTFLITSHMIGLEFNDAEDKERCTALAREAIRLINLIAPEEDKRKALAAHDEFSKFIQPQLNKFCQANSGQLRQDCLLYDFGSTLRVGNGDKLDSFIELVNGLFQAGLGATGSFFALCLHLMLNGDDANKADDIQAWYLAPERSIEDKTEAVAEYIRVSQKKLGGIFPRYSPDGGTLMGETIKPNSLVYMSLASANLDERAFHQANRVDPERIKIPPDLSPAQLRDRREKRLEKSLSFSYGEHMCPGRRIALVIIRSAMDTLFELYPDMEVVEMEVVSEIFGKPSEVTSFKVRLNKHTKPNA
jgi:cytochrome P450